MGRSKLGLQLRSYFDIRIIITKLGACWVILSRCFEKVLALFLGFSITEVQQRRAWIVWILDSTYTWVSIEDFA